MSSSTYRYLDTTSAFRAYRSDLRERNISSVAVDIEAEFNLHIYGEHFCLLQVFDGRDAILVDPYSVEISELKEFFEDRSIIKITYDAAGDRSLLFRNHGIRMRGILDLRPAVELLEYQKRGLSAVLESAIGKPETSGKKRYQQYNWTLRPIDTGAIEYALDDVRYLFKLRNVLMDQIVERSLLDAYIRDNLKVQDLDPETGRAPGILRSGQYRHLSRGQQEAFRGLYEIRDRYAQDLNLPPNTVLANRALFDIVRGKATVGDVRRRREVPADRYEAMVGEMKRLST